MSSILKALKRLEQQKMVRKGTDHDIAWIVRGEDYRPEKKRQWPMFVSLVAVAIFAGLSTYWFMGGFQGATRDSLPRPEGAQRTAPRVPAGSAQASPQPSRAVTPPVSTPDSVPLPPAVVNRPAQKVFRGPGKKVALANERLGGKRQVSAPPRTMPPQTALPLRPESVPDSQPSKSSLPALHVTGIAWEKDSPVHLAIVNGTSVVEGSLVNGAKVEKILPDRVRFTFENRSFDVPLD